MVRGWRSAQCVVYPFSQQLGSSFCAFAIPDWFPKGTAEVYQPSWLGQRSASAAGAVGDRYLLRGNLASRRVVLGGAPKGTTMAR